MRVSQQVQRVAASPVTALPRPKDQKRLPLARPGWCRCCAGSPRTNLGTLHGVLDPVGLAPFAVVLTGLLVVLMDLAALRWPRRPA